MIRRAATLAALSLTLLAARSDPLVGRVAGPPVDCIDSERVQGPDIVDNHTILYRQSGRRIWVTHPADSCPALRPVNEKLVVERSGLTLCRNDRFQVLEAGSTIPSSYCRFGAFTPYDKAAR